MAPEPLGIPGGQAEVARLVGALDIVVEVELL
jgi:hypothetical protein